MSALHMKNGVISCHTMPVADDIIRHDMISTSAPASRSGSGKTADVHARRAREIQQKNGYPSDISCVTISTMFAKAPSSISKRAMRVETTVSTLLWGRPYEAAGVVRHFADARTEQTPQHVTP